MSGKSPDCMDMDVILAVVCLGILTILLLFLGQRFKIPSIVCFLVIGMLAGPYALSIVSDQSTIETIGEIGVILLLFTIGLEFSFEKLLGAWRVVVLGGAIQVCTTVIAAAGFMHLVVGLRIQDAIFFGFLVSLSSTAIVMKVLQDRGDVETVSGRTLLGILIFQDLAVIPMILLTPLLMGTSGPSYSSLPFEIIKVVAILVILIVSAHWVVPWVMYRVAQQKNRELFIFTIAGICFTVAWLTNAAGLSYSLGAFMAGLIIGESDFSIDAVSNIIPFRDIFAAIFFISIGMLLDTSVILSEYTIVFSIIAIILVIKVLTGTFTVAILGMPARVCVFVGLALAQIGEFSFVLAKSGLESNLIGTGPYQFFLAAAIITMALTPFTMNAATPVTSLLYRLFPGRIKKPDRAGDTSGEPVQELSDHIVIVGYGMTGKSVARAAEILGIPYTAIDMDPDVVRRERYADSHREIIFGDATHREILEHAGIGRARALVVVISEQNVVPGIIHLAREMAPKIYIVVRTRHVNDARHLLDLGADEVIPEEFETSVRIFTRVLAKYTLPENDIDTLTQVIRGNGYRMFSRAASPAPAAISDPEKVFGDLRIRTLKVAAGSKAAGKTLRDLDAWNTYGVGILAIRRGTSAITAPAPDLPVRPGDFLILYGADENIQKFLPLFGDGSSDPHSDHPPASAG
ncbi:cation:proton antiporter [Methanoregula sp.]|uniref:cation:proton antiporter domain-containing protein n=1 Tax=Methanoregula sp. TaxID=2052170 RepID=UPI003BB1F2F9